jgi:hypothetical protein
MSTQEKITHRKNMYFSVGLAELIGKKETNAQKNNLFSNCSNNILKYILSIE